MFFSHDQVLGIQVSFAQTPPETYEDIKVHFKHLGIPLKIILRSCVALLRL